MQARAQLSRWARITLCFGGILQAAGCWPGCCPKICPCVPTPIAEDESEQNSRATGSAPLRTEYSNEDEYLQARAAWERASAQQLDLNQTIRSFWRKFAKFRDLSSREEYGTWRSRQGLSNEYLIAKIGFDTAENGPFEVWCCPPQVPLLYILLSFSFSYFFSWEGEIAEGNIKL